MSKARGVKKGTKRPQITIERLRLNKLESGWDLMLARHKREMLVRLTEIQDVKAKIEELSKKEEN